MREVQLHDGNRVICERCFVAESPLARMRGLLGRRGLDSSEGLLLQPASSIHMFFMRFPIDAVFLGTDGEVLKIVRGLAPWRLASCRGAKAVIELPAGEADRRNLREGTLLHMSQTAGMSPGPAASLPPSRA